jgi:GNAT superfamily N-acetyltransferase
MSIEVRAFRQEDVPDVFRLMCALSVYEGYADELHVREADLVEHGLGEHPRFGVLVANREGELVGITVHYVIPWTYDLQPTLILKELYVTQQARRTGVGRALFPALRQLAKGIGAARMAGPCSRRTNGPSASAQD